MPLVMVVVLFFVLPKGVRLYSLLFLGLSPLMILGGYVDQRMQTRAERREDEARFRESLELLQEELLQRRQLEHASRLREAPSTADGLAAIEGTTPLLWSRRPDRRFFLDLRLGLGTAPSRTVLRLGDRGRARAEHWSALMAVHEQFRTIDDVPIVATLDQAGGVGVAGPQDVMNTVARSLVIQLAALHSPADLAIAAIGGSLSVSEWDWLKWLPHVASPHNPTDGVSLASNAGTAERLASAIEELIARRTDRDSEPEGGSLPKLVLVVLDDAPIERNRLVAIAEAGIEAGVHVALVRDRVREDPRGLPLLHRARRRRRRHLRPGSSRRDRQPDQLRSSHAADRACRRAAAGADRRLRRTRRRRHRPAGIGVVPVVVRYRPGEGSERDRRALDGERSDARGSADAPRRHRAARGRRARSRRCVRARPARARPARARRRHDRVGQERVPAVVGAGAGGLAQPAAGDVPVRRLQGRRGVQALHRPAALRRPRHRPRPASRPPRTRLAACRVAPPRAHPQAPRRQGRRRPRPQPRRRAAATAADRRRRVRGARTGDPRVRRRRDRRRPARALARHPSDPRHAASVGRHHRQPARQHEPARRAAGGGRRRLVRRARRRARRRLRPGDSRPRRRQDGSGPDHGLPVAVRRRLDAGRRRRGPRS